MEFDEYRRLTSQLSVGKVLPDAVYLHRSLLDHLPPSLVGFIQDVVQQHAAEHEWNLVKLHRRDFRIALLSYPTFSQDSYPTLDCTVSVDLVRGKARRTSYRNSKNPPILHRKESMVAEDHPQWALFEEITKEGEEIGLYANARKIGFRRQWLKAIDAAGYELIDGRLKPKSVVPVQPERDFEIVRHRTAIERDRLSSPMQCLSRYGYLSGDHTILDYGCGKGDDVRELEAHGLDVAGWDPAFRPDGERRPSDIVNLGFVINVIEQVEERRDVLARAHSLAKKLLVVAAMTAGPSTTEKYTPYLDGVVTSRNTFQKYYTQSELSQFLEQSLQCPPIAVRPGVFFVFTDPIEEQEFLSKKQRVHRNWRQLTIRERATPSVDDQKVLEANTELAKDFWRACLDYGRVLANDEYDRSAELRARFGSHKRAYEACVSRFGTDELEQARLGRIEDITVYLALSFFGRRQAYAKMPKSLQRDIKAFFGSATAAQALAQETLFSVANTELITNACFEARARLDSGHLEENGAYVFQSTLLDQLPCLLRIYVGCASQLFGDVAYADLIKIHMASGKVSLMLYDNFAKRLPVLRERVKIRLKDQEIDWFHYGDRFEPQPLYLKSLYLSEDDPDFDNQEAFDRVVSRLPGFEAVGYGPALTEFQALWEQSGRSIQELER